MNNNTDVPFDAIEYRQRRSFPFLAFGSPAVKRGVDVTLASVALIALAPLLVLTVLVILIMDGKPIFVAHPRVGRNGEPFRCLKFRTMVVDAEDQLKRHLESDPAASREWQSSRKLKNDPRITAMGRVLRDASLDELPQLINILRGEMSLVGPRPIVPEEEARYGDDIVHYRSVRPGLTGLWQCSGRNNISYAERVQLDAHYVKSWSLLGDVAIMMRTVPAVFMSRGVY